VNYEGNIYKNEASSLKLVAFLV